MSVPPPDPGSRTAAILVAYKPIRPIDDALLRLRAVVGLVIVVDNAETGLPALQALTSHHGAVLLAGANRGGLAGAYNLALDYLDRHHDSDIDRVVFVDDDSDPAVLTHLLDDAQVQAAWQQPSVAAITPAYRDRATGMRGKYLQLARWRLRYLPRRFDGLQPVTFVINSMSVWRRTALRQLGGFHEGLRVDHVDTEYCLRARRAGYRLLVQGSIEFDHAIGERRRYRLFGVELQAGGHSPARRYLIGRNTAWLARTWCLREPAFALLCLSRIAYEAVGIVAAEDNRARKLSALSRGVLRGLFMPMRAG